MPRKSSSRYTVLITASGVGDQLGEITNYINKTLIKVGKKPTISYIIEAYPKNTEYIVTLGHYADQVREFLNISYPDRNISFVEVDKFKGEGSSLAYSMLQAKSRLQKPFVYHASDTIVSESVPYPNSNWLGGYKGEGSSHYASFDVVDDAIQHIYGKGMLKADFLYVGTAGIKNYKRAVVAHN
jgi:CTP:phosphocholine cytidylyltransferase-like protein